jgi:plastocyanin
VGRQSSAVIIVLSFIVLFSLLYISTLLPRPVQYFHDSLSIPTEPKISQLEALEIAVQAVKKSHSDLNDENIRLWFSFYNFSEADYEKHPEKYRGHTWTIATIKQYPELLELPLEYFHPNGTLYDINPTNNSYSKGCEECYGPAGYEIREDHLLWRIDITPQPVDVDAETGKIVWPNFNPRPFPSNIQIYDNITNARTIKELLEANLNPPLITEVEIVRGAAEQTSVKSYRPENARGTLEINNKVEWTNNDVAAHTVTSDTGYSNPHTGQFSSSHIEPNAMYEYTFMDVGEYPYHCEIHPWMRGKIVIVENFA